MEDMRLALIEQEDTQTQQELVLEAKLDEIDALIEGGIISRCSFPLWCIFGVLSLFIS